MDSREELSSRLASDLVASHFKFADENTFSAFDEAIAVLMVQLEDFIALQGMVNEDTSLCFDKTLPQIRDKSDQLDRLFSKIEDLESFVEMMKGRVDEFESVMDAAENELDLGVASNVRRALTRFLPKRQPKASSPNAEFTPVYVPNTSEYFENSSQATSEIENASI